MFACKRLVDFHRVHQVGCDRIQFDLPHTGFRRGNRYSVYHRVAQTRLCSANLHILSFALIALDRDGGHASQCIRDIRVRQRGDHFRREYLQDVFCGTGLVDGLGLAMRTFRSHDHGIVAAGDLQNSVNFRDLTRGHGHGSRVRCEANIGDSDRVSAGRNIGKGKVALGVRRDRLDLGLQLDFGAMQG